MLEHFADFTAWPILTGICVGYVANRIMSGEGKGCCMNLIIGIIGSYVGTFISHLLNIELLGKYYGIDKWKAVSQRGQSQTRLSYAERKQPRPKVKYTKK